VRPGAARAGRAGHQYHQHQQGHDERPSGTRAAAGRRTHRPGVVTGGHRAMSRIGKQPVAIPAGVKVKIADGKVMVEKGPLKLEQGIHKNVKVELGKISRKDDQTIFTPDAAGDHLRVSRKDDERLSKSVHGLMRTLINNMVVGVTQGYEKKLKIEGVGY